MLQTMDFAKILTPDKVQITITEKNHALSVSDMKLELIRFILSLSDESVMYLYNIIKSTYETENELLEKLGKGFEVVKSMENKLKTNGIINPNL